MPSKEEYQQNILRRVLKETPLHPACELEVIEAGNRKSTLRFRASEITRNAAGKVHGGILYTFLDVGAYVAALTLIKPGQNAVTISTSFNIIRPVDVGRKMEIIAAVNGFSRTTIFCDSRIEMDGKLVATGQVTKSIVDVSVT